MTKIARTFSLLAFSLAMSAPGGEAQARPRPAYMPIGSTADAPFGFVEMCARDKSLCMLGAAPQPALAAGRFQLAGGMAGATGAIEASPAVAAADPGAADRSVSQPNAAAAPGHISDERVLRRLAKRINSHVNRSVVQIPDHVATGMGELWSRPVGTRDRVGDCEDLAIEKRAQLAAAGFPAERMFYAVSFVRGYGLHTVLVVRLDDGDYILDSMAARMRRWSATKQVWLRRQLPGDPLRWARLDGAPDSPEALAEPGLAVKLLPAVNPS